MQRLRNKTFLAVLVLFSPFLLYAFFIAHQFFFFSGKVKANVYLVQRPFQQEYDLRDRRGLLLVSKPYGWQTAKGYLFGESRDMGFFVIRLEDNQIVWRCTVNVNCDVVDFEMYMQKIDPTIQISMTAEENESHLIYNKRKINPD